MLLKSIFVCVFAGLVWQQPAKERKKKIWKFINDDVFFLRKKSNNNNKIHYNFVVHTFGRLLIVIIIIITYHLHSEQKKCLSPKKMSENTYTKEHTKKCYAVKHPNHHTSINQIQNTRISNVFFWEKNKKKCNIKLPFFLL